VLGTNVEEEIAWRCDGVSLGGADLAERVEFRRSRPTEEPVPRTAPNPQDA
jgi:hypothetical protein